MPSYRLIWVEIAQQQYDTLSEDVRLLVDHRLTQLLGDPTADAVYNRRSDQWSISLGDHGLLFYALSWGGQPEETRAERLALEALDAYATAPAQDRSFGHEANTRIALVITRVSHGEVDGAAEALAPVLELPPAQRTHGIVTAMEQVRTTLSALQDPGRDTIELAGAIEAFTSQRLARAL